MKLDPTVLRTMNTQDFRVMEAVEKGMRDHELVPEALISSNASLRHGGAHKIISTLLRDKLLSHERKKHGYDGYRLTNAGYDILALHNLKSRGFVSAFGQKIGTGKESDVYLAVDPSGEQIVLKFHRLGRTSFRNVKKKRDYFGKAAQQAHSWLFLSRLSALKEYAFMKALYDVQYPTPTPIAHNRHIVVMGLVRGVPLYQIFPKQLSVDQAADIFDQAVGLASRLARHGLVHCDLNEFNLMVDLSGIQKLATAGDDPYVRHSGQSVAGEEQSLGALSKPAWEQSLEAGDRIQEALPEPAARLESGEPKPVVTLIDFPQMISTKHPNAKEMYDRDMACLRRFFELKLLCTIPDHAQEGTSWEEVMYLNKAGSSMSQQALAQDRLDEELRASGFNDKLTTGLELYYFDSGNQQLANTAISETFPEQDEEDDEQDENEMDNKEDSDSTSSQKSEPKIQNDGDDLGLEDDDVQSAAAANSSPSVIMDASVVGTMDREKVERAARNRVRRQLEDQKKKNRKNSAFQTRNHNKSYMKGKRILKDDF